MYHRHDEPWPLRVARAVLRWFSHALDTVSGMGPGEVVGVLAAVAVLVVVAVLLRRRMGPVRRTARVRAPVFADRALTAAEHRAAADRHAAAGEFAAAVRERFRALAAELDERGLVEVRPGSTADELAARTAAARPELGPAAAAAAEVFDAVVYGGRPADAAADARVRAADELVRDVRVPAP